MFFIESIAKRIGSKTAKLLELDKDKEEVIAYGAFNLLHTSFSAIILLLFGLISNSLLEVAVISLTSALLRQYTGGTHAGSPGHCTIITTFIFGLLSQVVKYSGIEDNIYVLLFYQVFTFAIVMAIVYKYCPVDNPNKRITKEITRKRLRQKSFVFLFVLIGITVLFWLLFVNRHYSNGLLVVACIHTGMLWQAVSLTKVGFCVITLLDKALSKIIA